MKCLYFLVLIFFSLSCTSNYKFLNLKKENLEVFELHSLINQELFDTARQALLDKLIQPHLGSDTIIVIENFDDIHGMYRSSIYSSKKPKIESYRSNYENKIERDSTCMFEALINLIQEGKVALYISECNELLLTPSRYTIITIAIMEDRKYKTESYKTFC